MGLPTQFTKVLVTPTATSIAAVQAHALSGALTLSASPIFASQRRLSVTLTASNSGAAIVAAGTNESGTPIGETITVSATGTSFTSVMDYKTITSITSTTLVGNVSVGGSNTGSSPWQAANIWNSPPSVFISASMSTAGAAAATIEGTVDLDPCGILSNAPLTSVTAFSASLLTAFTTSGAALITVGTSGAPVAMTAWRLTIISGTGAVVIQAIDGGSSIS